MFKQLVVTAALATGLIVTSAYAQDLTKWRHGTVQPKGDSGLIYMAANGNLDEKFGLDMEMSGFQGDAIALRALLAGEIDSYEGNPAGPMIAASKGGNIKIVGCHWQGFTYNIYAKDLDSAADLRGKNIAVSAPGALPDIFARAVLLESGIGLDEVTFVSAGGDADRVRAVSTGVADAAPSSSEFTPLAKTLGLKPIVEGFTLLPKYMRLCMIMSGDAVTEKAEAAKKFLAAEMAAYEYSFAHRYEVLALSKTVSRLPDNDETAAYAFDEATKPGVISPTFDIDVDKLNWLRDVLVKTGNIAEGFEPSSMVEESIREGALELLKSKQ